MGGRHGEFKFLPPSGYAPCYEALLPKEKMRLEPVKEYKRDADGVRDLLGTTQFLSQASFIPCPIDTSQVSPNYKWQAISVNILRVCPPPKALYWRVQINSQYSWKIHIQVEYIRNKLFF